MVVINFFKNSDFSQFLSFKGIFHLANEPSISKFEFTKFIYYKLRKLKLTKNYCKITKVSSDILINKAKRPLNTSFNLSKIKRKIKRKNFGWKGILIKNLNNFK